ncbi:nucleotidyltransferase domain-containing protein [Candidatus Bipolaricaulota bacterium]|nr:nucleotidyltransferase domain-containing protein [Candidatus Bipolaricaulota bacterium]
MKNYDSPKVDPGKKEKIQEIVDIIVDVADPQKIILFGSLAQGKGKQDSDIDLLVVKEGDYHKGKLIEEIYMNLVGVGQAVDVVMATPQQIERYRDTSSMVIKSALDEGKVIYGRGRAKA